MIEKVVEVLFSQLFTLMTTLCGNRVSSDGDSSPTPMGTPDTPIVSLSPTTDSEAPASAFVKYKPNFISFVFYICLALHCF